MVLESSDDLDRQTEIVLDMTDMPRHHLEKQAMHAEMVSSLKSEKSSFKDIP